jgi:hypothetical protein
VPVAVIGDKRCDIELARALGVPGVLVTTGYGASEIEAGLRPDYVVDSIAEATAVLRPAGRTGQPCGAGRGASEGGATMTKITSEKGPTTV